ncbi:MAG: GntR family transcriptional regulator [Vibrionaceae bacterium]|nr:GntR family transcriptional regulator [Vibrionaceae bacterium]
MATAKDKKHVYDECYKAIISLKLPPDTRLVETKLVDVFSVKRPVIREVLKELSLIGLVNIKPNVGAFVAAPTVKDAVDIMNLRKILEKEMITPSLMDLSPEQIQQLESLHDLEKESIEHGDKEGQIHHSMGFHLKLAEYSGNKYLYETLKNLLAISSLVTSTYGTKDKNSCHCNDHLNILTAIKEKNIDKVKTLMSEHITTLTASLNLEDQPESKVDYYEVFNL